MILPFNTAWKCCETCHHWQGHRNLTPFGLLARRNNSSCHIHGINTKLFIAECDHHLRWEKLDSIARNPESAFC